LGLTFVITGLDPASPLSRSITSAASTFSSTMPAFCAIAFFIA